MDDHQTHQDDGNNDDNPDPAPFLDPVDVLLTPDLRNTREDSHGSGLGQGLLGPDGLVAEFLQGRRPDTTPDTQDKADEQDGGYIGFHRLNRKARGIDNSKAFAQLALLHAIGHIGLQTLLHKIFVLGLRVVPFHQKDPVPLLHAGACGHPTQINVSLLRHFVDLALDRSDLGLGAGELCGELSVGQVVGISTPFPIFFRCIDAPLELGDFFLDDDHVGMLFRKARLEVDQLCLEVLEPIFVRILSLDGFFPLLEGRELVLEPG